jgi:hypothetical protein
VFARPGERDGIRRASQLRKRNRKGGAMIFEYWLAALVAGEMLLVFALLRAERS